MGVETAVAAARHIAGLSGRANIWLCPGGNPAAINVIGDGGLIGGQAFNPADDGCGFLSGEGRVRVEVAVFVAVDIAGHYAFGNFIVAPIGAFNIAKANAGRCVVAKHAVHHFDKFSAGD